MLSRLNVARLPITVARSLASFAFWFGRETRGVSHKQTDHSNAALLLPCPSTTAVCVFFSCFRGSPVAMSAAGREVMGFSPRPRAASRAPAAPAPPSPSRLRSGLPTDHSAEPSPNMDQPRSARSPGKLARTCKGFTTMPLAKPPAPLPKRAEAMVLNLAPKRAEACRAKPTLLTTDDASCLPDCSR